MTFPAKDIVTMNMTNVSNDCKTLKIEEIDAERYQELRQKAFWDNGFVDFPLQVLSFAVKSVQKEGGKCVQIIYENKPYGIIYRSTDNGIQIYEITVSSQKESQVLTKLFPYALVPGGVSRVTVRQSYLTLGVHLPGDLKETCLFNLVLD